MANTIGFGQAAVNNTNGFGKAPTNNTIDFGEVCSDSWSPETNLTGAGGTPSFSNTQSTEYDGMDAYVAMGDVLDFDRLDAFSISCWFKRGGVATEFLVDKSEDSGDYRGYSILIPNTDNKIYFTLRRTLTDFIQVKSNTAITDTDWHNLVITYSGSGLTSGVNIYIDNVNDTGTGTGTLSGSTITAQPLQIGARNGANNFLGKIDEVSIFNSELSASDITSIYNSGVPNDISSLSPLSWWRCGDGDTAPTIVDNGSGGNNGTMTNFSTFSTDVPT